MKVNCAWRLIILISILFVSCTNQTDPDQSFSNNPDITIHNPEYGIWQNSENPPVSFELEQVYGAETEDEGVLFSNLFSIVGPVTDTAGTIYLIDQGTSRLMSFSSDGTLLWDTGQEGEGPGDLMRPRGLAIDGEFLYLDNNSGSRIDKFDLKGNFVESLTWSSSDLPTLRVIGFLPNRKLVTSSTLWGEIGVKINVLDISDGISIFSQFDITVSEDI
ncbi:MAG: 6-bladed beta-propeller, partial [Balneolaceae bacterium]